MSDAYLEYLTKRAATLKRWFLEVETARVVYEAFLSESRSPVAVTSAERPSGLEGSAADVPTRKDGRAGEREPLEARQEEESCGQDSKPAAGFVQVSAYLQSDVLQDSACPSTPPQPDLSSTTEALTKQEMGAEQRSCEPDLTLPLHLDRRGKTGSPGGSHPSSTASEEG